MRPAAIFDQTQHTARWPQTEARLDPNFSVSLPLPQKKHHPTCMCITTPALA